MTLLFSIDRYRDVLEAYFAGLEDALGAGRRVDRVASVASFFLSRIDTKIDREIDALTTSGDAGAREAQTLRGSAAVASARVAYATLVQSLASERFLRLRARGAHAQRLLWASTGTKDPAYSPNKYVEPLIGPHTVNTMPLETLKSYHNTGEPRARLTGEVKADEVLLDALGASGIDLAQATALLLDEGIEKFVKAYDSLIGALDAVLQEESRQPASRAGDTGSEDQAHT